jgi:hypothetical protein
VNGSVSAQNRTGRPEGHAPGVIASETRSEAAQSVCGVCGAPVRGDRFVCSACTTDLANYLLGWTRAGASTSLLDELTVTATRQARMTRPGDGGRSSERPLPFDERTSSLVADDSAWLLSALRTFGAAREIVDVADAGRHDLAALWLYAHVELIAAHAHGVLFAHDAARRSTRAARAIDRPPGTWYAGRCVECTHDLYAAEGAAFVECASCGTRHDVEQQRERLLAAVEDRLATASEVCRAVHLLDRPVTRSQIDHWVERGQLARRGRSTGGHFLYRIGDILTLVATTSIGGRR